MVKKVKITNNDFFFQSHDSYNPISNINWIVGQAWIPGHSRSGFISKVNKSNFRRGEAREGYGKLKKKKKTQDGINSTAVWHFTNSSLHTDKTCNERKENKWLHTKIIISHQRDSNRLIGNLKCKGSGVLFTVYCLYIVCWLNISLSVYIRQI